MPERRPRARRSHRSHRVMAALALSALALSAVALAACNLLTGLDADYSSNGRDAAASGDGGGVDGATLNGPTLDGSTKDGPVTPESGADGATTSWCQDVQDGSADQDFFCTDFETDLTFGGQGWTGFINTNDAGSLRIVADGGKGGSRGLEVLGTATSTTGAQTRVHRVLDPVKEASSYRSYQLDFDLRLTGSGLQYDAFGLLVFAHYVAAQENGIAGYGPVPHLLSRQATGAAFPTAAQEIVNAGLWYHATITLDHTTPAAAFDRKIVLENVVADTSSGHAIDPGAPTELWMGVFNTSTNAGTSHVYFDNVVLRRQPF